MHTFWRNFWISSIKKESIGTQAEEICHLQGNKYQEQVRFLHSSVQCHDIMNQHLQIPRDKIIT